MWLSAVSWVGLKGATVCTNPDEASTTTSAASEERSESRECRRAGLSTFYPARGGPGRTPPSARLGALAVRFAPCGRSRVTSFPVRIEALPLVAPRPAPVLASAAVAERTAPFNPTHRTVTANGLTPPQPIPSLPLVAQSPTGRLASLVFQAFVHSVHEDLTDAVSS